MKDSGVARALDTPANALGAKEILLYAVLIGVLATFLWGYRYGLENHIEELPVVFRLLDASFAPRDFFVDAATEFGPRYYYSRIPAALGSVLPLSVVYALLTCLANSAMVLVTYLVARALFRGSGLAAMMACALVMGLEGRGIGLASYLHRSTLNSSDLARPLALVALWAGIRRRPLICAAVAAIASLVHPLVGLQTGGIGLATAGLAAVVGLGGGRRSVRTTLLELLRVGAAVVGFGAFMMFVWVLPQETTIGARQFVEIVAHYRNPHHYLPSTWPVEGYAALFCFLAASAISWRWWYNDAATDKSLAWRVLIPALIVLVLCLGGYLFVEVFPSRLWTTAQTFRLLFIVKWLGLIMVGGTIARCLKARAGLEGALPGWLMLLCSGLAQPFVMLLAHLVRLFRQRLRSVLSPRGIGLGIGAALAVAVVALMKYGSVHETVLLCLFAGLAFWFVLVPRRWYRFVFGAVVLCVAVAALGVYWYVAKPSELRSLTRLRPVMTLTDIGGPAVQMAHFARRNTPEDAVFLTSPRSGRFRIVARRAIVVDFKSFPFQDWAMVEWRRRLRDCYGEMKHAGWPGAGELEDAYRHITDERLLFVAEKYGASYAVLYRWTETALPVVCQNIAFKIVKIEAAQE